MTTLGIIGIILSSTGGIAAIILSAGAATRLCDKEIIALKQDRKVKLLQLKNEHLKLEMEREKRLLA